MKRLGTLAALALAFAGRRGMTPPGQRERALPPKPSEPAEPVNRQQRRKAQRQAAKKEKRP